VHDRTAQNLGELAHQWIGQRRLRVASCPEAGLGVVEASDLAVGHGQRVVDGGGPRLGGKGGFEPRRGQLVIAADQRGTTHPEECGEETGVLRERALVRSHCGICLPLLEHQVAEPDE